MHSKTQEDKINNIVKLIKNPFFALFVIGFIGLTIRLYYFSFNLPVIDDSIDYFSYAVVVSQQGQLPIGWGLTNNGWPVFLSLFFTIFDSQNFLEFTYLQRFLTIVISVLTIIPVYLVCTRFVEKQFAIIGASLFVFDPRIIINSLLGISEPAYILLGAFSLFLFLSKRYSIILISFFTLALLSIIRYEGFLILIPFIIIFIMRFKKDEKIIQKTLLLIGIFFITILPMAFAMNEATGNDGIISPIFGGGIHYISTHIIEGIPDTDDPIYGEDLEQNRFSLFLSLGLINLTKFLGWVLIPTFVVFAPVGFFLLLQNRDYKTFTAILFGFTMLIPAFYLYGRGIEETRYLYIIFPILCLISTITIKKITKKFKKENIILILIIFGILSSSIIFLDYKKIDYEHEEEAYLIAKDIVSIAGGINHYSPESRYIHIAEISNDWPIIPLPKETNYNQSFNIKKISPDNFSTLDEYIESSKEKGLTHIVTDGKQKLEFLNDVFYNETDFPYLIEEYDSQKQGFQYRVKVYKIDYEKITEISSER